ncbi:MAG TPA: hypothetical protein VIJ07_18740 [Dermatophilaceae bacterium]
MPTPLAAAYSDGFWRWTCSTTPTSQARPGIGLVLRPVRGHKGKRRAVEIGEQRLLPAEPAGDRFPQIQLPAQVSRCWAHGSAK